MVPSLSNGSSGPRPKISSRISRARRSRSAKLSGTPSVATVSRTIDKTSSRADSLEMRPSFSRFRRSRILLCSWDLICWYSVVPNKAASAIALCSYPRFKKWPLLGAGNGAHSAFPQRVGQTYEGTRQLGVVVLRERAAGVDRRRHRLVVVRDLPEQLCPRRAFDLFFTEPGHFAEPVQHQADSLPPAAFPEKCLYLRDAPQ